MVTWLLSIMYQMSSSRIVQHLDAVFDLLLPMTYISWLDVEDYSLTHKYYWS